MRETDLLMNGVADWILAQRLVDKKTEVHRTHVHRTVTQQYSIRTVRTVYVPFLGPGIRNPESS